MPPYADGGVVPYGEIYTDRLGNMPVRQYLTTPIYNAMVDPETLQTYNPYTGEVYHAEEVYHDQPGVGNDYDGNGITIGADRININFDYDILNRTSTSLTDSLREELDKIMKKIYHCIEEHTNIDITEEEFMAIIKDDD